MSEELTALEETEIRARIEAVRVRMRPLEEQLAGLRGERDLLLTELRRRERLATRERRAGARDAVRSGEAVSLADLIAASEEGGFDAFVYNLRTGGEVRLGFPGARAQTVSMTDGARSVNARDLSETARCYAAGWEPGTPGRPGLRVHFPGTRQERLVDPGDVFARARSEDAPPQPP